MKKIQLIEKITHNWQIKIVCLIISVLLYFTYQGNIMETRIFSVPLSVVANRDLVPAQKTPKTIRIVVKASKDIIDTLQTGDFSAYIDADQYLQKGIYSIPIQINLSQRAQLFEPLQVDPKPKVITMLLEERTVRDIPIKPIFTGEVDEGFEVTGYSCSPDQITITGPKTAVENSSATLSIVLPLANKNAPFTQTTQIKPLIPNDLINISGASSVYMNVNILPKQLSKTFSGVTANFVSLNPYFQVKQLSNLSITVSGAQNTLKNYKPSQYTAQVDCSSIETEGEYSLPVSIHLPDGLTLVSISADYINISVEPAPVILPEVSGAQ
ncbi:MAG: hypothetical protein J5631_07895 [Spirochaetaceae bacterium]|nr:hypothetical protein [Spirochaetaceae bacterium]MBR4823477.1 hypothetical protein [Spirochaetaceae bacterium]